MRVCDICRGGSDIGSIVIADSEKDFVTAPKTEWIKNEFDACSECVALLKKHDWIALATRSGQSIAEDYVKKGTTWLTDQLMPQVKALFDEKTDKFTKAQEEKKSQSSGPWVQSRGFHEHPDGPNASSFNADPQ